MGCTTFYFFGIVVDHLGGTGWGIFGVLASVSHFNWNNDINGNGQCVRNFDRNLYRGNFACAYKSRRWGVTFLGLGVTFFVFGGSFVIIVGHCQRNFFDLILAGRVLIGLYFGLLQL